MMATVMSIRSGDGGDTGEQTQKQQRAADHLYAADERSHHLGCGDPDSLESPCAELIRIQEFQDSFEEEHPAHDQPDQDGCRRRIRRQYAPPNSR